MINISSLSQYFPEVDTPVTIGKFTFRIVLDQSKDTFIINLKIKQQDTKEEHLVKFRLGIGKDKPAKDAAHETNKPHFEIDIYKRKEDAYSLKVYFTFQNAKDEELLNYCKGTLVIIARIIKQFIKTQHLNEEDVNKIIFDEIILHELSSFEPILIEALYGCYLKSDLVIVDEDGRKVIKTSHNIQKYLGSDPDLIPLFKPLLLRIEQK